MNISVYTNHLLLKDGFHDNYVIEAQDGKITDVFRGTRGSLSAAYITPGVIDNHLHGGDDFSVLNPSVEEMKDWLMALARNGVCGIALCPHGSKDEIRKALDCIKAVMTEQKEGKAGGTRLLGAHLEGPFLSNERLGGMLEKNTLAPTVESYNALVEGYEDIIVEMSLAPENEGADELISYLHSKGIKLLAGHTDSDYETAVHAFSLGVGATCHTFNASRPVKHRDPGVIAAALTDERIYCEFIGDLEHLHPAIIKLIFAAKGPNRPMLISDAVRTTNMPDGIYDMGDYQVEVKNGVSRVKDLGCLDGGGCYSSKAVKRLVNCGIPAESVLRAATINPASWLGLPADIKVGNELFLTGWDEELNPLFTIIGDAVYSLT